MHILADEFAAGRSCSVRAQQGSNIVDRTECVAASPDGHDLCLLRNQSLEIAPIELARLRIHLRDV